MKLGGSADERLHMLMRDTLRLLPADGLHHHPSACKPGSFASVGEDVVPLPALTLCAHMSTTSS